MDKPMEVVEVSDDEEETTKHHVRPSQLCEVSSSSNTVRARSASMHTPQKGRSSSTSTTPAKRPGRPKTPQRKTDSSSKQTAKNNIVRPFPLKMVQKPIMHDKINEVLDTASGTSSNSIDLTKISATQVKTITPSSKQQIFLLSPINNPNVPISKIFLVKSDPPVKTGMKEQANAIFRKAKNQSLVQSRSIEDNQANQAKVQNGRPKTNCIREQRVYLKEMRELTNEESERVNTETKSHSNPINTQVPEEQDPLYIPEMQEILSAPILSRTASKGSLSPKRRSKRSLTPKPRRKSSERRISHSTPAHTPRKLNELDILTPIVTLTEPVNSEHSVVRNYSLLNKVTTNKKITRVRSKSVPARPLKKETKKSVDSDLIYKNKLSTQVTSTDTCRHFFIKNSAWDFLEGVFGGFNEREQDISQKCSNFFSQITNQFKVSEKEQKRIDACKQKTRNYVFKKKVKQEAFLSNDDLFYTRKIEVLNKEGKPDKVYYVPPQNVTRRKRKAKPVYTLPATKRCKVVLQRDEKVENILKKYLLTKKLNSNLCHHLGIPRSGAKKPLIILNKANFGVLRVNETLCQHANIIFVKDEEDDFPEKLYDNEFFISKIETKSIKLVTPGALKHYFM